MDSEINEELEGSWHSQGCFICGETLGETFGDQEHSLSFSGKTVWAVLVDHCPEL